MKNHRAVQEVNAGSMADIAFLLLIFFLVTASIENDAGLSRMLPSTNNEAAADIKKRNLFEITINNKDEIMADGEIEQLQNLRKKIIRFIDNGGLPIQDDNYCSYCKGERLNTLSEHPSKAIISIKTQRNTSYPVYVAVQNEVIGAYNYFRNSQSLRLFNTTFEVMNSKYHDAKTTVNEKVKLKEQIEIVRKLYPQKIVEPETINN
ncbi:ExbD/TolR family protein [Maribacter sp. R77961]|uniref:ExbD/TolR family protein n=1 Tax=Maribacter sp. R77961 TaxID=3093871 RepID=UPI0037C941A2